MTTAPFNAIEVQWKVPSEIIADGPGRWNKVRIYRSTNENVGYNLVKNEQGVVISEIDSQVGNNWVTYWHDTTQPMSAKDDFYYLIRYYDEANQVESKFYLTFKTPSPREQRLILAIRAFVTPWVSQFLEDDDIRGGIILALNAINIYPPQTNFTLYNFPIVLEPLLVMGAGIFALMFRYLGVAITDLSYNDQGFSLTIDRGSKVKTALDQLLGFYKELLPLAKMDYAFPGVGVGTLQLPVSIGFNIQRGILNVLDLLTSLGR